MGDLIKHFDGLLVDLDLRPPLHDKWIWLIRPHGYVPLATTEGHLHDVAAYLNHLVSSRR